MEISNFIKIYKNVISNSFRKHILKKLENTVFVEHYYGKNHNLFSPDSKLFRADFDKTILLQLNPLIEETVNKYITSLKDYNIDKFSYRSISKPVCNRYIENSTLPFHIDYTHEFGLDKGLPLINVVGLLQNSDEGGNLEFLNVNPIDLQDGDIIVFPSTFLYPHRVTTIKKGTRFSFSAWAW